jgi:uncharacterized protein YfkK (UPF0435 family)
MALPKIKQPIFELTIPSTKEVVRYRPYTVSEEKLVLIARESNEVKDIINVYKQIINNCVLDIKDVDKLAYFDLEYIFLMLRAKSVSNVLELTIEDDQDSQTYKVKLDLEKDISVSEPKIGNFIKLTDPISVVLKYPSYEVLSLIAENKMNSAETVLMMIRDSIDQIFDGETAYDVAEYSKMELDDWVMSLGTKDLAKMQEFFVGLPKITANISYKRRDGSIRELTLEGIQSFFG